MIALCVFPDRVGGRNSVTMSRLNRVLNIAFCSSRPSPVLPVFSVVMMLASAICDLHTNTPPHPSPTFSSPNTLLHLLPDPTPAVSRLQGFKEATKAWAIRLFEALKLRNLEVETLLGRLATVLNLCTPCANSGRRAQQRPIVISATSAQPPPLVRQPQLPSTKA